MAAVVAPSDAFVAADGWDSAWHLMGPDGYAAPTIPSRLSSWRHRGWRNCLFADGHVKAIQFRVGLTSSSNVILLPRNKNDYNSYCINPDATTYYNGDKRCGDIPALFEASVSKWIPD